MNSTLIQTIFQAIESRKADKTEVDERFKRARSQGKDQGNAVQRYNFEASVIQSYLDIPLSISSMLTTIETHILTNPIPIPEVIDQAYINAQRTKIEALAKVSAMRPYIKAESDKLIQDYEDLIKRFESGQM